MTTDFLSIYLHCEEKIYLVWYEHCRQYPVGKSNLHSSERMNRTKAGGLRVYEATTLAISSIPPSRQE